MKEHNIHSYFLLFLFGCIITLCIVLFRGTIETVGNLTYLGNFKNCIIMIFRQITEISFITVFHYWLYQLIVKKLRYPTMILNIFFLVIYIEIFLWSLSDFFIAQNSMQYNSPSFTLIYQFRLGKKLNHFSKPNYYIPSPKRTAKVNRGMLTEILKANPTFKILEIIIISSLIFLLFIFIILYHEPILKSSFTYHLYYKSILENITQKEIKKEIKKQNDLKKKFEIKESDNIHYISTTVRSKFGKNVKEKKDLKNEIKENIKLLIIHYSKIIFSLHNFFIFIIHILGVVYIINLVIIFYSKSDFKLVNYSTYTNLESRFLCYSHYEKIMSDYTKENFINFTREYLPPGRKWLDARPNPIYPAIHSDLETFCAYNNWHNDCIGFKKPEKKKPLVKKLPNVVLIIYESFTPNNLLISNDFLKEHANVSKNDKKRVFTDTKYYSEEIMPELNHYQNYAVTFSGMSSLGVPTSSGLHSLMSGMEPSQTFYNILEASKIHSDDFPSQMKSSGYRTFYINAAVLQFDCINFWVWRRSAKEEALLRLKCEEGYEDMIDNDLQEKLIGNKLKFKKCENNEIEQLAEKLKKRKLDFPTWFDYTVNYFPSKKNFKYLNLPEDSLREETVFVPDRLTAAQFIIHWKQQKEIMKNNGIDKPIFGAISTIESHFEFFGYDKEEFYTYNISEKNKKNKTEWNNQRFIKVNKYADKYLIGKLFKWLKENEPNTIFAITGDHGSKKIPMKGPDETIIDDIVYSSDCVHHSSGTDSFYVTSGIIGYLGDDPEVKKIMHLDDLAGKTLKIPTDHNDLIYTIEDILSKLNGTSMQPTHRRNRNLLDLTKHLIEKNEKGKLEEGLKEIDDSHWRSFSVTNYFAEFRQGTNMLRTHPADPKGSHYYERASYPQCIRKKINPLPELGTEKSLNAYDKMFRIMKVENYLTFYNRLYNYNFRNKSCVENGYCEFPNPAGEVETYDIVFIIASLIIHFVGFISVYIILEVTALVYFNIKSKKKKLFAKLKETK